jgi:hypothetical protein
MKNIKLILVFVLGAFVLASCEEQTYEENFEGNDPTTGWIEFRTAEQSLDIQSTSQVTVPIDYNVSIVEKDVTVTYEIRAISEGEIGVDLGTFEETILKGTRDIAIDLELDNTLCEGYVVEIEILSVSEGGVVVGLPGVDGNNPIVHTQTVGNFNIPTQFSAETFIGENSFGNFILELEATDTPGVFTTTNAWGEFVADATGDPGNAGNFDYPAEFTFNFDNSFTVVGDGPPYPGSPEDADNTFDFCNGVMTYTLSQGVFGQPFVVDVVLTPLEE